MQEYRCLNGNDADSALAARSGRKTGSSKRSKCQCGYCNKLGHTEDECRKKKRDQESNDGKTSNEKEKKKGSSTSANAAMTEPPQDTITTQITHAFDEFPSDDDDVHVFIALDIVALLSRESKDETYIDSGCSRHLSPCREYFLESTYITLNKPIKVHLGDASVIQAIGKESIRYLMTTPKGIIPAIIPNVLYIPELAATLLSIAHFTDRHKHHLIFDNDDCFIHSKHSGHCVATAHKTSGSLYRLIAHPMTSKKYANTAHASCHIDINILHCCLGHLGHDNVKRLVTKGMVEDVDSVGGCIEFCEACVHGKQHRFHFPQSGKHACHKLDLVHSNVCGPLPVSFKGFCYFITFCDDNTRKVWIYFMRTKSEAYSKFREFKALVELQTGLKIKVFRSDGGGEYISLKFKAFLKNCGIIHQKMAPHTPEQNGVTEVLNCIIVECG